MNASLGNADFNAQLQSASQQSVGTKVGEQSSPSLYEAMDQNTVPVTTESLMDTLTKRMTARQNQIRQGTFKINEQFYSKAD